VQYSSEGRSLSGRFLHTCRYIFSAVWGSIDSARCAFQSRLVLAALSFLSFSAAPLRPRAISAAWAAIFAATTPVRTSSVVGRPRCSLGVT